MRGAVSHEVKPRSSINSILVQGVGQRSGQTAVSHEVKPRSPINNVLVQGGGQRRGQTAVSQQHCVCILHVFIREKNIPCHLSCEIENSEKTPQNQSLQPACYGMCGLSSCGLQKSDIFCTQRVVVCRTINRYFSLIQPHRTPRTVHKYNDRSYINIESKRALY